MNNKCSKIIVCCPARIVTGGTELLHQLVHELRLIGKNAYICYYPFNERHETPTEFGCYDTKITDLIDDEGVCVVIPETKTELVNYIKKGMAFVWWMSVDNYYGRRRENHLKDVYYYFTSLLNGRKPLFLLRQCTHLAQSAYARNFLKKHGIDAPMLTDYLAIEHLASNHSRHNRENLIAYNPKKGIKKTRLLISKLPEFKFVPIQNMGKADVANLLSRAKIYMDFGQHPGKDRMPREAAMAGCCIITGVAGSANNDEDIPIDHTYKFNDTFGVDVLRFRHLVNEIFINFDFHSARFDHYRAAIKREHENFKKQVANIF